MKKHLKNIRQFAAICDAFNDLILDLMMAAFLLIVVTAVGFWLWWYPLNYLTEGDRFHERRVVKLMKCVGFKDTRHVAVTMPTSQFCDFKTTCAVWVTNDNGETYHPIELTYRYERRGWLEGKSSVSPTREAIAEWHSKVLDRFLEWSGKTRKQFEEIITQQVDH